ncbi:MAG: hypothetical protein RIG63_11865 [Coleofasciculus chthonoplastes F3-SA18-01]
MYYTVLESAVPQKILAGLYLTGMALILSILGLLKPLMYRRVGFDFAQPTSKNFSTILLNCG